MQDREQRNSAVELEKLAAELDGQAYAVTLVKGDGCQPRLSITSRRPGHLTEHVYAGDGSFWWGWAHPIGPLADVTGAAAAITNVLRFCGSRP